jgi:cobalt-zinc-cadmium efflux system outer membrane protein
MQRWSTKIALLILFFCCMFRAQSQTDSLRLNFVQAEHLFFQQNLELISQRYNISINKALLLQNRYWDNPVLSTDQNIYDGKFFRHDNQYGQVYIQLLQLIKTAGKRNKSIQLARDGVVTAEQQFDDVMRNLRFILSNDFSNLDQLLQTNNIYQSELLSLQALAKGMDAQLQAGNISQRENIRIKSLLFGLQSDQAELQLQVTDIEKELHTLLRVGADTVIVPVMEPGKAVQSPLAGLSLTQMIDSSLVNRPDLQLAGTNLLLQQHNLTYQKALAVPDVTAGIEFDQRSSYAPNYYGLAISVPLPVLNKNKGNIRAARFSVSQAETGKQQIQEQVTSEVAAAWNKLSTILNLQQQITPEFTSRYEELMQNITRSFQLRQISLIEFIDFFDAYKDARIRQLKQQNDLRNAIAELNFATGTSIISNR